MLVKFSNPILGVVAGAVLTAIIQSSSASVGILQALSTTGAITYSAAIPIILGQNIGTCITAFLSSVGGSKNARRTAMVHFYFNLISPVRCCSCRSPVCWSSWQRQACLPRRRRKTRWQSWSLAS